MEAAAKLGAGLVQRFGWKVQMKDADLEVLLFVSGMGGRRGRVQRRRGGMNGKEEVREVEEGGRKGLNRVEGGGKGLGQSKGGGKKERRVGGRKGWSASIS
jgi:hypothetical protein